MNFKTCIAQSVADAMKIEMSEVASLIEIPPQSNMGDFALPCFSFSKTQRKAPQAIALELKEAIAKPSFISRIECAGAYLNFFVDEASFAREVIAEVIAQGEKFGGSDEGNGRSIVIDYSSINIAKPFHIGHLSSTAIGHALYNIYNFMGYRSFGINYLGDWGTQFGKLIVAFKRWGDKSEIEANGVSSLLNIYVRFHKEAEEDPALDDEARAWFKKIESGDKEALELFGWFKDITLKEVSRIYDLLGITFDSYNGESFYNDKMGRVIDELKVKKLLEEDDGAWVVKFPDEDKMPPCLLLKGDGATLYATRDIASALYRKDNYDFYKALYVVSYQQNLHFKQWFKVVEMMGYEWAKDLEHVAFGMVSMEDGTLSTRNGRVIFLEDVLMKSIEKSREIIEVKSPALENKDEVAQWVGVGALVYNTLSSSRIKDITFSWDRALNFEGETGPYCQYTHARACSVLSKGGYEQSEIDYSQFCDQESKELIKEISEFPDAIRRAMEQNEPYIVTRKVTSVAQAFNKFYFEHRILDAPESTRQARLALTDAARTVISTGLKLLGIVAPKKM